MKPDSLPVHAGRRHAGAREPLNPPIYQTSVYAYDELDDYDAVAKGEQPGHTYGRTSNENVTMLGAAVAELEGAEAGLATASGMAAVLVTIMALCPRPRPIVAPRDLYGGTWVLLRDHFQPLGYEVRWTDLGDRAELDHALDAAGVLLCETVTNPLQRVVDVPSVCSAARRRKVPVIVDNSYLTPLLQRPLAVGATAVVHSVTKYLAGHWDLVAGAVAADAWTVLMATDASARLGTTLGPFEAWLALRGLRTLSLRVHRQSANALALAWALEHFPGVERVHYPGLKSSPYHRLAAKLLPQGTGGMLAFDLDSREAVQKLLERLQMVRFAASFGGIETTVSHPEVASHRYLSREERATLGITPGTVRVSLGIEHPDDIIEDFRQALEPA